MRWSWKIGRIAGIGVYIHTTFVILIAWIALVYWRSEQSFAAVIEGVGFVLALFGCVVLHELGHALAARRYGIGTRDITLLPIGGVARLERMPEDPKQEIVVAVAGPLVNVVIAAAIFAGLWIAGHVVTSAELAVAGDSLAVRLMLVNIILVAFNMIPAFPMDGGRVLRALLATRLDYATATQKAARIGQVIAIVFGVLGIFSNVFLVFIALFVWVGAAAEANAAKVKSVLSGASVSSAMLTDFATLQPTDTLGDAVELTMAGYQKDFPVIVDGQVVGILTQSDLLAALKSQGATSSVENVMRREVAVAESTDMLEPVVERLQQLDHSTMVVTMQGEVVGLVTLGNISEFMMIQSAVAQAAAKPSN